jgi:PhoPQ-activated pathogenicity-related protein
VTSSKIQQKRAVADSPDRRGSKRVQRIQPCVFQLAQVAGYEIVEFSDGHALSLNASLGGFLLLMPQSPECRQVFEVHTPMSIEEGRAVKLVEVCWTRELTFGTVGKVYLVGVKSIFEPARFN